LKTTSHEGASGVEASDGSLGPTLAELQRDETLPTLRRVLPTGQPLPRTELAALDRGERRETPLSTVLLNAPSRDRATLTVLSGADPGCVLALERGENVLGRSREATLAIDEPAISRRHARVVRTEDGRHILEDLGSQNGTFVNGRAVSRVVLRSGDRIQLGPDVIFRFALLDEREETLQRRLYESSTRDSLTGLANRRCLLERLELAVARAEADGVDTGMLMIDVDHFKQINDSFGHLAGDKVLRALATSARANFRAADLFARYGGEEFAAVVCCEVKADLVALAERVRASFAEVRVAIGTGSVGATVSVGVALWSECGSVNYLDLLALADERMYAAKIAGRNSVCSNTSATSMRPIDAYVGGK
jgi:two-component system cell cycle response regulator